MADRYPGYDVLRKWHTPSWNEKTRAVVSERLAIDPEAHAFFNEAEWRTLKAVCARIVPQPATRTRPVPLAAMVDAKMHNNELDGYRDARMPPMGEAWKRGLAAVDAEANLLHKRLFHDLDPARQDALLTTVQQGQARHDAWGGMAPDLFFKGRVLHDIVAAYYSHPSAWSEIGFGGPASPRGYVRLMLDRRDPWEAAEAKPGHEGEAWRENRRVR